MELASKSTSLGVAITTLGLQRKRNSPQEPVKLFLASNQCKTGIKISAILQVSGQLFHLIEQLAEQFQSLVDGFGTGHIHAGALQQIDGALAAAAGEEAQVILQFLLTTVQNLSGQCNGCGIAGGILEDIVVIVEVRNSCHSTAI